MDIQTYRNTETGALVEAHPINVHGQARMAVMHSDGELVYPTEHRFREQFAPINKDPSAWLEDHITPQQSLDASDGKWKYLAMDEDGEWTFFAFEPIAMKISWLCESGIEKKYQGPPICYEGDWRDSLHKRGGGK